MDIIKTFELFLSVPISIIHKRNIKIMHIETNIFAPHLPVQLSFDDDIQLTVYNNKKVYNLLSSVIYKRKQKDENNKSKISDKRTIT